LVAHQDLSRQDLDAHRGKHEQELAAHRDHHQQELAELKAALGNQMLQLENDLKAHQDLSRQDSDTRCGKHEQELAAYRDQHQKDLAAIRDEHRRNHDNSIRQAQQELAEHRTASDSAQRSSARQLQQELAEYRDGLDNQLAALNNDMKARLAKAICWEVHAVVNDVSGRTFLQCSGGIKLSLQDFAAQVNVLLSSEAQFNEAGFLHATAHYGGYYVGLIVVVAVFSKKLDYKWDAKYGDLPMLAIRKCVERKFTFGGNTRLSTFDEAQETSG